jgi:hypothetical protein
MTEFNLTDKVTIGFSLEKHINLLEQDIQVKNTEFRKLRQDIFILNQDLESVDKNDKLEKLKNDNELNLKIHNLDDKFKNQQRFVFSELTHFNSELQIFAEETNEMDHILADLEQRLQKCQDKIGMFD